MAMNKFPESSESSHYHNVAMPPSYGSFCRLPVALPQARGVFTVGRRSHFGVPYKGPMKQWEGEKNRSQEMAKYRGHKKTKGLTS
jgi:hypothetical protein